MNIKDRQGRKSLYMHFGKTCFLFPITDLLYHLTIWAAVPHPPSTPVIDNIPELNYKVYFRSLSPKKHVPYKEEKAGGQHSPHPFQPCKKTYICCKKTYILVLETPAWYKHKHLKNSKMRHLMPLKSLLLNDSCYCHFNLG